MGKEEADREQDQEGAKQREGAEHEAQMGARGKQTGDARLRSRRPPLFFLMAARWGRPLGGRRAAGAPCTPSLNLEDAAPGATV